MWYSLNSNDKITGVSPDWDAFADHNGASALKSGTVLGRPIWDFFQGRATQYYYGELMNKVRADHSGVSMHVRCDGPRAERHLLLSITPALRDGVEILVKTLRQNDTDYRPMWDSTLERSKELVTVCSWCKHIEVSTARWLPLVDAFKVLDILGSNNPPDATHGICPSCQAEMEAQFMTAQ